MLNVALFVTLPEFAEMVAEVFAVTCVVTTVKLAELAPAGTRTLAGTFAMEGLLLVRLTETPPTGAGPLSVTVPVEELPPLTVVGDNVREERLGGFTVIVVVLVTVRYDAEMVATLREDTGEEPIWNVAEVAPEPTVTLAGTVAAVMLLDSEMVAPPAGAGAVRFTVPTDAWPPTMEVGFAVNELSAAGPLGGL